MQDSTHAAIEGQNPKTGDDMAYSVLPSPQRGAYLESRIESLESRLRELDAIRDPNTIVVRESTAWRNVGRATWVRFGAWSLLAPLAMCSLGTLVAWHHVGRAVRILVMCVAMIGCIALTAQHTHDLLRVAPWW